MGKVEVTEPLYLCVHVPEFPAQALLRLRPDLARSPVVVLAGDPPLEQVCSTNTRALRLGVAKGMTRAELDTFAGLSTLRHSDVEERHARAVLLEAAGAFTPRIEIYPSASSAFVMVLDMAGTTRMFGTASQAAASLAYALSLHHFFVRIATSTNLHVAVSMAAAAQKHPVLVPSGRERDHLGNLPLTALNLKPQQADTLALWGIHTLGDIAALPEVDLIVRLGQEGKRLRLLALGEHPHLMVPVEPVFTLEEFIAFDSPMELLDSLLFVLGPMLDQLLARAQNRAFALASVTMKLRLEGGGEHERTIKPALPVAQREVLLKLLHLDLQAHPPVAGILSVLVRAEPGDRSKVQLGLFAPHLPEPLRLDITLARVTALVGEGRVGRATLLDNNQPDSFKMERFTVSNKLPCPPLAERTCVSLRRCRPPQPLHVQMEGQCLSTFILHGKRYRVEQIYGPWRKSGSWWSRDVWSSEEWDVQAAAGADDSLLCLITHDLLRRRWQLEAHYD